jgi:UDP:flavonoid glycosyltransferase YjiC (YdhE family)
VQQIPADATRAGWQMAPGADAIMVNINTTFGLDIAEALDIPSFMGAPQPMHATIDFPMVAWPGGRTMGGALNRISQSVLHATQAFYNLPRNRLRRELMSLDRRKSGRFLRRTDGSALPTLYCYSEVVSPRPADWPDSAAITGYWRLEDTSDWAPSPEFSAFLAAGEAPVYVGFGSMPFGAERNTQLFVETLRLWGGRAVVARGWGGIKPSDLPANCFVIDKAPHDKLFPLMKAVVHHGGAGTTAAGLYAGRPSFVVPQTVDQPFWGRRVFDLGCGPAPIGINRITPAKLAAAMTQLVSTPSYAAAAGIVAQRLAPEDGPARAIEVIEAEMARFAAQRGKRVAG